MRNMNVSKVLKMMLAIIIVLFAAKFYTDKGAVKNELIATASGTSSKKVEKEKALEEAQNSKDKDGKTSKKAKNSQDKFDKSKKNQGITGDRKYNIDYDHVLGGDINYKSGKVTGGHTLLKGDVKIVKKYGKPSKSGVYKAIIEVKTPLLLIPCHIFESLPFRSFLFSQAEFISSITLASFQSSGNIVFMPPLLVFACQFPSGVFTSIIAL